MSPKARYPRAIARPFAARRALLLPRWPSAIYPAALLLALLLPFEAITPVTVVGGVSLTDEKLVLLIVLGAWVLQGQRALPTLGEWRAMLPSLAFLLVNLASARVAGEPSDEALKSTSRLVAAAFGLLVALRLSTDAARARGLLWAVIVSAGASALLGAGEALGWAPLNPLLSLFKVAPTRVGGELRVSASFQYATIAAMYFEMVAPLAIVLAATARQRWLQVLAAAVGMACAANVVLSLTRAGVLTLALEYAALLGIAAMRSEWRKLLVPTLASAAVLVAGVGVLLRSDAVFDLRLASENDADWYGAAYSAPTSLSAASNQSALIALDVRNEGRITWTSSGNHPFALGYRWLTADGTGVLDLPPAEVGLAHDVAPGETIRLNAVIDVPNLPAGTYRLDWGMLQRDVLWFYERGWADAETEVRVERSADAGVMPAITPRDDAQAPWVVGRLDLWGAALRMFAAQPLLGVGPDNFRHLYGADFGLEAWDERVQANNVYLEILADLGIIGLAAFMWVVVGPLIRSVRGLPTSPSYLSLGVAISLGAFLVHGLLDSFLTFTPTAMLLWMLLGVAQAQKPHVSGR